MAAGRSPTASPQYEINVSGPKLKKPVEIKVQNYEGGNKRWLVHVAGSDRLLIPRYAPDRGV